MLPHWVKKLLKGGADKIDTVIDEKEEGNEQQ